MFGEDQKLISRSKVDLACLPLCPVALKQHIQRVNQRAALYTRANEAILEKTYPYDDGQGTGIHMIVGPGVLVPTWLVDMLVTCNREVWSQGLLINMRVADINSNMHRWTNNFSANSRTTAIQTEGVTPTKQRFKEGYRKAVHSAPPSSRCTL